MSNADDDVKKGLAEDWIVAVALTVGCRRKISCRSEASITLSAEQLRKREGELLYEVQHADNAAFGALLAGLLSPCCACDDNGL